MDDLISRQAAIDALGEEPEVWTGKDEYAQGLNNQWHYDVNALKAVPSAQPEPSQIARDIATIIENEQDMRVIARNEIIRCKDCKHNPKHEWFGCPMSHLDEKQRPETAWCWKGERRTDEQTD